MTPPSSAPASASQDQKSRPSQASSGRPPHKSNVARPGICPVYPYGACSETTGLRLEAME